MSTRVAARALAWLVAVAALAAGGYGLYRLGLSQGAQRAGGSAVPGTPSGGHDPAAHASGSGAPGLETAARAAAEPGALVDPKTGRRVLYWHDPMVPGQRFNKPGKSPFMDMDLVPVYADEAVAGGGVTIDPRVAQNLGVRLAPVVRERITETGSATGSVALDERSVVNVQTRTMGYIERLHVRAPYDPVRAGAPLATLFVPDWSATQIEYLAIRASGLADKDALLAAARERLALLSVPEAVMGEMERTGRPVDRYTLTSPIDGYVAELMAREGQQAMPGMTLFRLASARRAWVNAEVPEALAGSVRPGGPVEITLPAWPGEKFRGRFTQLLPQVNPQTRTVTARIELDNPGGRLKPGMTAALSWTRGAAREVLSVPSEAVIVTGVRTVAILAGEGGTYRPVEIRTGRDFGERIEVLDGLHEGERVVASGQFLIDSEASLRSAVNRLEGAAPAGEAGRGGGAGAAAPATPAAGAAGPAHSADGVLESIAPEGLVIRHGPVPTLQWGPMTMQFKAPAGGLPPGLKSGDAVRFEFVQTPKGEFEVTRIARAPATAAAPK